MEFKTFHKDFFNAKIGAFSRVTEREDFDSQITLTGQEADIVLAFFGKENIQVGGVKYDKEKSSKKFHLYPSLNPISLNLIFPKTQKPELRIYVAKRSGFRPIASHIWFIYISNDNQLVIGHFEEDIWNNLGQDDIIDESYQQEIENASSLTGQDLSPSLLAGQIITKVVGAKQIYLRDPRLAVFRFRQVNYSCEVNAAHETFVSERTKQNYMEAHHFIPMKFQDYFDTPLDNFENIISLCPTCHRAFHHSIIDHKVELIKTIFQKRPSMHQFSVEYIAEFYNSIKIPYE